MAKGTRLTMTSEEYTRCERVQSLMNDREVRWYFGYLREKYIQNWQDANDPEIRESMWHQMKALDDLVLVLTSSSDVKTAFDSQEQKDES